jgi:endonuclease YncB( thermonuclease family)
LLPVFICAAADFINSSSAYLADQDIAEILLETGAAWVYRDYLRERYLAAENTTKNAQIGLWRGHPVALWVYRQEGRKQF